MARFHDALARFRDRLVENAGHAATITRKTETLGTFDVVPEITKVDYLTDKGIRTTQTVYDFCVPANAGWTPERGDRILWDGASYIVRPVGAEWWKYDDAEKTFIRVHTQIEAQG